MANREDEWRNVGFMEGVKFENFDIQIEEKIFSKKFILGLK